jgi:hypothetical protein
MESTAVRLRGWDYPHLDREGRANGNDWIASWVNWERHIEYWRLFQSGQFIHHFAFWEDYEPHENLDAANRRFGNANGFTARTFLDPVGMLYTLTEIYQFASRLALAGILGAACTVELALLGTLDRVLWTTDPGRAWFGLYRCTQTDIARPAHRPTSVDIIERPDAMALEAALWFFERFGWHDPPVSSLRDDQARFLARAV